MGAMNGNGPAGLEFRVHGAAVTARLPDAAMARAWARLYGTGRVTTGGGGADLVVERTAGGYLLHPSGGQAGTPPDDLLPAFEWALTQRLLDRETCCVHLHAAGAVDGQGAVLALGATGAGKSTLALHWSVAGLPVLGDDTVLVDATGRAHPFPRLFKIDPAGAQAAGLALDATPWWTPGGTEAWYDPADRSGWAEAAPVRLVVVLRYVAGARLRAVPLSRAEGLGALLQSRQVTGRRGAAAFEALASAVAGARVVGVTHGRTETLAPVLTELAA